MRKVFKFIILCGSIFFYSQLFAYQAVIFDCDGVLVDTEGMKFAAWQKALQAKNIYFKQVEYLPLVGFSSEHIAQAIKKQKQVNFDAREVIVEKDKIYHHLQKQGVPIFSEAVNYLKQLIQEKKIYGIKLGLASSASRKEILENLKQIGVKESDFDMIISGKDDLKDIHDKDGVNKPKPYIYQKMAILLQVAPDQCLVFEDSQAGVEAAYEAGMDVIAVPNRFTVHQDFSKAMKLRGAKYIDGKSLLAMG